MDPDIEAAVVERFLATGKTAAEIAHEFGISEAAVWAFADRATDAALDAASTGASAESAERTFHVGPQIPEIQAELEGTGTSIGGSEGRQGDAWQGDEAAESNESGVDNGPVAGIPVGSDPGADDSAPNSATEADDLALPAWVLETAERSLASGDSLSAVAQWYGVPESVLQERVTSRRGRGPGGTSLIAHGHAGATSVDAAVASASAAWPPEIEVNQADAPPPDGPETGSDAAAAPAPVAVDPPATAPVPAPTDSSAPEPVAAPKAPPVPAPVLAPVLVPASEPAMAAPASAPAPGAPPTPPVEPAATASRPKPARRTPTIYSSGGPAAMTRRPSHPSSVGFRDFFLTLRRRVLILMMTLLLGAAAGWVTAPGETHRTTAFEATHTLIYEAEGAQRYNIEQVALLANTGEVPSRVAARLKLDRTEVRSAVSAVAEAEVGTISITGRSLVPETAVALADVTAEELEAEISGQDRAAVEAELSRLRSQVDAARRRLNAVPPKNVAERAAAQADVQVAERALQQYEAGHPVKPQTRSLEKASAAAVSPPGVQAPNSKPVRAALLGLLGLLAGIAGAFALDRLDSRIRSKAGAEEAFGVPVIAEVPRLAKASQGQLLARTQPSSPFVEAYRSLRTYVALWAPEDDREDGHRVIVVTSPSPSEGKTTTVAHLAAMLAEIGRSVVVISADLRRPRLHHYFDVPDGPGLIEALGGEPGPPSFTGLDQPTSVRGVRLVPSGPPVENPAPLFEHAEGLVQAVRPLADFVLIDAPPLLIANDAVEMARYADGVLLVARAGQTPLEAAEHCAETLGRLEIPIMGAVLIASEAATSASKYYSSGYYAKPDRSDRRRNRADRSEGGRPAKGRSRAAQEASATKGT